MLTDRVKQELEIFFQHAVILEDKDLRIKGWGDEKRAAKLIDECARAFRRKRKR